MSTVLQSSSSTAEAAPGSRKRLLLVSCHFPPVGGAGVQRPTKFVKYLGEYGWDVSVLTVANPSVPAFDESLLKDIPDEVHIEKARTWEPGYHLKKNVSANTEQQAEGVLSRLKRWPRRVVRRLAQTLLQPDTQILWYWSALKSACNLLRKTPHDAIMVTAPPYSAFLLGARLKEKFGLPLILDYRDEWDLSSRYLENGQRDWFSNWIQERMQRRVLRRADAVIATTQASRLALEQRLETLSSSAGSHCIYNGFDPDDFQSVSSAANSSERFRIVYTGTLWNLTSVERLVQAVETLQQRQPELARKLDFLFVGRKTSEQSQLLERIQQAGSQLTLLDYCPHSEALKHMQSADALCLLLSDVPGAERVVPAKLFEYLAQRKSILSILPQGESSGIVSEFFPESTFLPGETQSLSEWLEQQVSRRDAGQLPPLFDEKIQPYTRRAETGQLAEILNQVTAVKGSDR